MFFGSSWLCLGLWCTSDNWRHGSTDGEIFTVIKNGVPPELNMPPWGDQIADREIWNVVSYIRSLAKKK